MLCQSTTLHAAYEMACQTLYRTSFSKDCGVRVLNPFMARCEVDATVTELSPALKRFCKEFFNVSGANHTVRSRSHVSPVRLGSPASDPLIVPRVDGSLETSAAEPARASSPSLHLYGSLGVAGEDLFVPTEANIVLSAPRSLLGLVPVPPNTRCVCTAYHASAQRKSAGAHVHGHPISRAKTTKQLPHVVNKTRL